MKIACQGEKWQQIFIEKWILKDMENMEDENFGKFEIV